MNLELNKEQYQNLIRALEVTGYVYGPLGDFISDDFKKQGGEIEDLENYLLSFAKDFDFGHNVDQFEGKNVVSEEYSEKILDDVFEYDDYVFWEELARQLAQRDLYKIYSQSELKDMNDKERITKQYELEEKYWKEFEKRGVDRVNLKRPWFEFLS